MEKGKTIQPMKRNHLRDELEGIRRMRPTSCHANEPLKIPSELVQAVTNHIFWEKGIVPEGEPDKKAHQKISD